MRGAEKDLKNDCARQAFGTVVTVNSVRVTGVIATCDGAPSSHVITLNTPDDSADLSDSEMRYFFVGQKLDSISSAGAVHDTLTVSSIDRSAKTITVTGDSNTVDGDKLVMSGSFDSEMIGLRAWIDNAGTLANIDPSSVPTWAAVEVGSTSTGISEVLLDQAVEGVETDGDGSTPSLFFVEHSQRRKLASQLQAQKRYDGREVTLKAGWVGLQVARGTLIADRYCPVPEGFAITPRELVRFVGLDFTWDDQDGRVLFKALDGTDAVEARFISYQQLVTPNRNSHAHFLMSTPTF
jgi:hypothetical protein